MIFAESEGVLEELMGRTAQHNIKSAESGGVLKDLMGLTLQQTNYDICREWWCAGEADGQDATTN